MSENIGYKSDSSLQVVTPKTGIRIWMKILTHMHSHTHTHAHMHMHTHMQMQTHTHTHTHVCMFTTYYLKTAPLIRELVTI